MKVCDEDTDGNIHSKKFKDLWNPSCGQIIPGIQMINYNILKSKTLNFQFNLNY